MKTVRSGLIVIASLMLSFSSFAVLNDLGNGVAKVTWGIGSGVVNGTAKVGAAAAGLGTMIVGKTLDGGNKAAMGTW